MATLPLTDKQCQEVLTALKKAKGNKTKAAASLKLNRTTFYNRLWEAKRRASLPEEKEKTDEELAGALHIKLRHTSLTLEGIGSLLGVTKGKALDICDALRTKGVNLFEAGGVYSVEKIPVPIHHADKRHIFESDKEGRYRFGVVSDNHLGSKYAREDVLNDMYDFFAREGITRVYNTGNWIDGEARFNKFDLNVHGMQNQINYFAEKYPQRKGITTFFIAGDDHEGWYSKNEGVDIGKMAENAATERGRTDLKYLGYMEAYITLKHSVTGATNQMLLVHPGGGSSYAISYAPQKYVEALQGGEKPAVCIFGHWHKMDVFNYRNVWIIQAGTTEDQTPFMRKLKLEAHVGGLLVELRQDPRGAITDCLPWMKRYFDRGYYNHQFNPAGPIQRKP